MMKLSWNPASPFVRKVSALAIERGLADRIERVMTDPWNPETPLIDTNPLSMVPALTLEDGTVLVDSQLVCEYLDSLGEGRRFFPAEGPGRWKTLQLHSLANGLLTAGVAYVVETLRRPKEKQYDLWAERQRAKLTRTLDVLETQAAAGALSGPLDIGTLTAAIALGYLDFRFDALKWREGRPALTAWYDSVKERPSLAETVPKLPS